MTTNNENGRISVDIFEEDPNRSSISSIQPGQHMQEMWNDKTEVLAKNFQTSSKDLSQKHAKKAMEHKKNHVITGFGSIAIPIIMTPISQALADYDSIQYVNMVAFITTALFSAAHSFFGYETKYQKNMSYSSRYNDLYTDLRGELTRDRQFRQDSDRFLTRIECKMDSLCENAPDL